MNKKERIIFNRGYIKGIQSCYEFLKHKFKTTKALNKLFEKTLK